MTTFGRCEVHIAGGQCLADGVVRMEAMCEHEHNGNAVLCEHHASFASRPTLCRRCDEAGHRCLMHRATQVVL